MADNKETIEAFKTPKPGMRFSEMYAHWVYVMAVSKKGAISVKTFSGHPANPYTESIQYKIFDSAKDFRKAYAYGTIDGYYVRYIDNLAFERSAKEQPATYAEIEAGERNESD